MERYREQLQKRFVEIKIGFKPVSIKKWRSGSFVLLFGIICFFALMFSAFYSQYQINRSFNDEWTVANKYDINQDDDWPLLKKEMLEKQTYIKKQNFKENAAFALAMAFITIGFVIVLDKKNDEG